MRIAFYKGPAESRWWQFVHWLTCAVTRSPYSHCEFVFGDETPDGRSVCATSSPRDGGVRFKVIDLHSGHWDVFDLPQYTEEQERASILWFAEHAGAPYDWLGLLWFVLPIRFESPSRWFCSEAMAESVKLADPHTYHPGKLRKATRTP